MIAEVLAGMGESLLPMGTASAELGFELSKGTGLRAASVIRHPLKFLIGLKACRGKEWWLPPLVRLWKEGDGGRSPTWRLPPLFP
jgi:hypothetical protein